MSNQNFIQVVEELDEVLLGSVGIHTVYAWVGKRTKKLRGFKVVSVDGVRKISFGDIDNLENIVREMKGS